jgi:hypothetical protein
MIEYKYDIQIDQIEPKKLIDNQQEQLIDVFERLIAQTSEMSAKQSCFNTDDIVFADSEINNFQLNIWMHEDSTEHAETWCGNFVKNDQELYLMAALVKI